jgi:hypothetical protein
MSVSLLLNSPTGTSGGGGQQTGRLHIDGRMFREESGKAWAWRGTDGFLLYLLWLTGGPAAIDPVLADWFSVAPETPPNTIRVLGMVNSFARLHPSDWGEKYYTELKPFARYLFSRWAVRFEFVIFADGADCGFSDYGVQDTHAVRVENEIGDEPNEMTEVANEPSQHNNLPGGDARAYEIYQLIKGPGRMIATGAYDWDHPGDYLTYHGPRDGAPDYGWVRKANDLKDGCEATNRPTVGDEPMGSGENETGSRDTNPSHFAQYAAIAAMNGSGSTFHSDSGILARPFQPVQRECARAFYQAAAWPLPDTQLAPYNRGDAAGPCSWLGTSICQHDDAIEQRSYGKIIEPHAWVCQVQTQRAQPTACAGWQADQSGPSQGLTRFRRT